MGCVASNYITEEDIKDSPNGHHHHPRHQDVVMKCKERNMLMKNVVKGRQDFAIAHSSYIQSLQNVGLALRRVSEGPQFNVNICDVHGEVEVVEEEDEEGAHLQNRYTHFKNTNAHFDSFRGTHFNQVEGPHSDNKWHSSPPSQTQHALTYPDSPSDSSSSSSSSCSRRRIQSTTLNSSVLADVLPSASSLHQANSSSSSSSSPSVTRKNDESNHTNEDNDNDVDDECHFLSSSNTPDRDPTPPMPSSSSWFDYDIFNPPPIPCHLVEQRRNRSKQGEEEVTEDLDMDMDMDDKKAGEKDSCEPMGNKEEEGLQYLEEKPKENSAKKNMNEVSQEGNVFLTEYENATASQGKVVKHVKQVEEEEEEEEDDDDREACHEQCYRDLQQKNKELALVTTSSEEPKDLIHAVRHIHDHFRRASMSGKDVSCLLETHMVKHDDLNHSGSKDSSKTFNAIILHWSRKTSVAVRDACNDSDTPECGMLGSQAATLERIYAWERKLYDEVKAGEAIRIIFDRKCRKLQHLSAKKIDQLSIDKVRVSVKKLDTQLMVALQAIDFASTTIRRLTNEELYPQLAELLEGLMHMWRVMCECHRAQESIASKMQTIDSGSINGVEAVDSHIKAISDLERELGNWRAHFQRWITSQKNYISALNAWLSKCHMDPEVDKRGKPIGNLERPTILTVLRQWDASLEHLEQVQSVADAIGNFSSVVHFLRVDHVDNLDVKRIEAPFASSSFAMRDKECLEYKEIGVCHEMSVVESGLGRGSHRSTEDIRLARLTYERKEKILSQFREHLPYVFESMALFAKDAMRKYESLQQANLSM